MRGTALVKADTYYLPDPKAALSLRYRIVPEAGGGARSRIRENSERSSGRDDQDNSRILTNSATSGSEPMTSTAVAEGNITNVAEWYFQDVIRLPNLKPGKYMIEGSLVAADGKALGPLSAAIEKKDEARAFPEWWGKKFGNIERVLPPFTAMTRHADEVKCWGRTYTDYAMYLFERAYREGGVVSTYWDLTFPILTNSLLSGLSYRLPDGRVQPGYNGWNCRRFFMRLHALQQDHGLNPGCTCGLEMV